MKYRITAKLWVGNDLEEVTLKIVASNGNDATKAFMTSMRQLGFDPSQYVIDAFVTCKR